MAFDAAHQTIVMFGGSGSAAAETWTWDGTTWTKRTPAASPPRRSAASMTFDSVRNVVLLFGGMSSADASALDDTWTWDGTTWTAATPAASRPARSSATLAFDEARGKRSSSVA